MNPFNTSNSRINRDNLGLVLIVLLITIYTATINDLELHLKTLILITEALLISLLILRYFMNAYQIKFEDECIIQNYTYRKKENSFNYDQLLSIKHVEYARGSAPKNILTLKTENQKIKIKTNVIGTGDDLIEFIKFLKNKNSDFETYVVPVGGNLHTRMREKFGNTKKTSHNKV